MRVAIALLVICLAAMAMATEHSSEQKEVLSMLDTLHEQIEEHGLQSIRDRASAEFAKMSEQNKMSLLAVDSEAHAEPAAAKDNGIDVSFKWTKVDVRNFLTWLVSQNDKAGTLSDIKLGSVRGGKSGNGKKCAKNHRSRWNRLRALKRLETAGNHGGLWWYKVQVKGLMNAANILTACKKHGLKPACDHTAYSDGVCVNSNYNQGRHLSYPPHALEGWQNSFFPGMYLYCGYANGGWPLQNTGSTHRWSGYGEENRMTACVDSKKPDWAWHKKFAHCGKGQK